MESQQRYLTEYSGDVVEFLVDQHEELRTMMARVLGATGPDRQHAFDTVRQALARHEAAEEAVLRPLTRDAPGGSDLAEHRSEEEDKAASALALLETYDVDSIPFEAAFRSFEEAVLQHAEKEQTVEFPLLRRTYDAETLHRARRAVEEAEAGRKPEPVQDDAAGSTFAALLERTRRLFRSS